MLGAEIADLISKGFRRDILLGVDDCREVIELTAVKQDRQGARLSSRILPQYRGTVPLWLKFSAQVTSSRAHLLQRRVLVTA